VPEEVAPPASTSSASAGDSSVAGKVLLFGISYNRFMLDGGKKGVRVRRLEDCELQNVVFLDYWQIKL
jgi:hypothetical protein